MRNGRLPAKILVTGILGVALGACGNSTTGSAGSGGATGTGGGSGGDTTAGTGGATTTTTTASGGTMGSGGATPQPATGGKTGSGGTTTTGGTVGGVGGTGGTSSTADAGGMVGTGGANTGGLTGATGGAAMGGRTGTGGRATGGATGGGTTGAGTGGVTGTGGATTGGSTGTSTGTCTASKTANVNVSGTGSHKVVVESNSDPGVSCGTIYRPSDLGGAEKYPIFVWGEGGCSRSGTSNQAAMGEIASHGYFVVADGPTGSGGSNCGTISMPSSAADLPNMAKPLLGYIGWAIAENGKSCSAYYQSLDTTKIAADGFSCGGLMAEGTASDSRMTTWGITSSGLTSADATFYKTIRTPVKILLGGSGDVAYTNGERDYTNISALGVPILLLSKDGAGHGGDLSKGTGDFNTVNLAWLNWQLKGDEGATGKGLLIGSSCKYCNASGWEFKSANIQ
jgi:hypothetical protein